VTPPSSDVRRFWRAEIRASSRLDTDTRVLMLALVDDADDDGVVPVSVLGLAERLGESMEHVASLVGRARGAGFLEPLREPEERPRRKVGGVRRREYELPGGVYALAVPGPETGAADDQAA